MICLKFHKFDTDFQNSILVTVNGLITYLVVFNNIKMTFIICTTTSLTNSNYLINPNPYE